MSPKGNASATSSGNEGNPSPDAEFLSLQGTDLVLRIKLKPRSSRRRIENVEGDHLVVAVNAPAVGGKANSALVALLAEQTHRPKSCFEIIRGHTSRLKTLRVSGITADELAAALYVAPPQT